MRNSLVSPQSYLSIHLIEKTMVTDIIISFVSCCNQMLFLIMMGLQDETLLLLRTAPEKLQDFL